MYVRTRLGRWFYEERGKATRAGDPAIVLLHGLLFDGGMWRAQIEPLSAFARVLVFDGPGHGKSEMPPPFSLEDHADALMDALTSLGVERAAFAGVSWGGMLGMRVALRQPKRVAALALCDTSAGAEDPANVVKYRLFASFARRFGVPPFFAATLGPIMFGETTLRERPETVETFARTLNGFSRDGVARAAKAVVIHRKSISADIGKITAPTLVVCGREDRATPPSRSEAIARGIPRAEIAWIDGAGHSSPLEQPERFNAVVVPFLRANVLAR